ncbi:MAG TPA: GNAT family N-acetyltransferase [Bryobacteraceae bacterium]|jgi:RimJ/RimL family protein N-acetyltransferase|nr:GNAT family N-acetyltransferase [Bryobacteraceae bacterium]
MFCTRLRPREASDETFLFDLYSALRAPEFALLPIPESQKEQLIRMQYRAQNSSYAAQYPGSDYQIVMRDDCPVGKIWIARTEGELRLVDIVIAPEARNSGIGSSLIREIQREAEAAGLPVRSTVFRFNPGSLRFHLRLGFRIVAEEEVEFRMEWLPDRLTSRRPA